MIETASEGSALKIHSIINKGADIDTRNNFDRTPLHQAAQNDFFEAVEALIKAGADPNARDKEGRTPLALAILNNASLKNPSISYKSGR